MAQASDLYNKPGGHESPPPQAKQSRQRLAKFLPIALIIAFVLLLALLFGERFVPAREVQLESVVTQRSQPVVQTSAATQPSNADAFGGDAVFQASGWIEADPLPIRVAALNDGFVDTVHVLEGQTVTKGQLLVKLVDDDARLDLQSAKAESGQRAAALTEMQSMVRATEAGLERLVEEVDIEHARIEELRDDATRLKSAGAQSVSEQEITQSRLRVLTQQAVIQALEANRGELEAELAARKAAVRRAEHELLAAETDVARKQLALDRMEIRSPIDGIIQQLYVSPGKKRFAMMDDPESATIAKLYMPEALQARIDVPLEEAAQLRVGQAVRLRSVFLQDKIFEGRVSRIEGQADLQRNTLQAKVELLNSADGLRPEMLCRAEFLAPASSGTLNNPAANTGRAAVYVPTKALIERDGNTATWTLDASGKRATLQTLRVATEIRDGYQHVLEGLKPGARVVIHPPADLEEGDRIRPQD
ncbi:MULTISPECIES: efflux RND transporter periplasmic adaptor subunit [unclassified Lentimonas]|uniref:efflux RND transporter periplasmic adaptor subunit n=1 Tax=unclassified Lentimonas TaxID=2630993 RepID=UPI00132512AF|nr:MULTISPECIES: efflux RND transporter periplasmic adaptor subunit [unclassified Lentimonas]CAA6695141.1 Probable Co/Zn/Cd efflux system membrane fusion protein [Lentimonas sp. CC19]CAA6697242.1 Probable Co/Zn/Cd efflux system membrane fusion protein [Lentimonas sp. CC10]CAA7070455.1 Probable Co/Zn/Cd efflux system membrane fusion protein [Lentimonas sp. CC11]